VVLALSIAAAFGFWYVLFGPALAGPLNFWAVMAVAAGVLGLTAVLSCRRDAARLYRFEPNHLLYGVAGAALLYAVFQLGHIAATRLFDFAAPQISGIYASRGEASPLIVGLVLLLWVGPIEEIYWRGFVQDRLQQKWGPLTGFLAAAAIYALVHIWAFNLMLFLAAGLCGLFWGAVYWRFKSLWPGIISHALWDVAIFVLWPVG